jgi:CBS domain-containing protein
MNVGTLCTRTTYLAEHDETVKSAARRMHEKNVGTLVVLDAARKPVGIVTDRDLVVRVLVAGHDPEQICVEEVMTGHPRWVKEATPIEEALETMRGLGVRRLPVVDRAGRLAGIIGADDILEFVAGELGLLGKLVSSSHPGILTPTVTQTHATHGACAGLERAISDPQC